MAGVLHGATLAGYVPRHRGAAMSMLNLGAGASVWVGPAIAGLFLAPLGVGGVMWIFAVLYLISAGLTLFLTLPPDAEKP